MNETFDMKEAGPDFNRHRSLDELTQELIDKYKNTEHHVEKGKRLGMEELNQLSTELQYFFETYGDDDTLVDSGILVRYINGEIDIDGGEMEVLVEALKKFYERYLEKHE